MEETVASLSLAVHLSTVVQENEMANVLTPAGGIFRRFVEPGQEV